MNSLGLPSLTADAIARELTVLDSQIELAIEELDRADTAGAAAVVERCRARLDRLAADREALTAALGMARASNR